MTAVLWHTLAWLCIAFGVVGFFLPIFPGAFLSFGAILAAWLCGAFIPTDEFLLAAGAFAAVQILDFFASMLGAKKMGGSRLGSIGTLIGGIAGIFFAPLGFLLGPFLGALCGELLAGKRAGLAMKAAFGAFLGLVFGALLKSLYCFFCAYLFFAQHSANIVR